ncbi:hypothetical protein JCM10914A_01350 [Paenibacillus sp. JCM 10914]|uniref:phosphotransferase n=1 Tax=Paenibacillus sp. JCM 10914 TaxID=1236974 RepID=UPI00069145E3|nr:phosphotransferase [Paenibacillus sp. JCM 10914]
MNRLHQKYQDYEQCFRQVQPICFLDDITIKNVMIHAGELQGIIDLDWVCYGDPFYMLALTQTAIVSDIGIAGMPYIEALCSE